MSHLHFATVGHIFEALPGVKIIHTISCFKILGSEESKSSNGAQFGVETKKLWSFEDKRTKLSENFAAETPFGRVFRSCETNFGTRVPLRSTGASVSQLRNALRSGKA